MESGLGKLLRAVGTSGMDSSPQWVGGVRQSSSKGRGRLGEDSAGARVWVQNNRWLSWLNLS